MHINNLKEYDLVTFTYHDKDRILSVISIEDKNGKSYLNGYDFLSDPYTPKKFHWEEVKDLKLLGTNVDGVCIHKFDDSEKEWHTSVYNNWIISYTEKKDVAIQLFNGLEVRKDLYGDNRFYLNEIDYGYAHPEVVKALTAK